MDILQELHGLIFVLVGILMGMLLAIGIHYPLDIKELEKAEQVCPDHKVSKVKIGVSGRIYEVVCDNGIQLKLKPN